MVCSFKSIPLQNDKSQCKHPSPPKFPPFYCETITRHMLVIPQKRPFPGLYPKLLSQHSLLERPLNSQLSHQAARARASNVAAARLFPSSYPRARARSFALSPQPRMPRYRSSPGKKPFQSRGCSRARPIY